MNINININNLNKSDIEKTQSYHTMSNTDNGPRNVISALSFNHHSSMQMEHRDFVSAIFDLGMKAASPASVFSQMSPSLKSNFEGLNLERIKSKLQKYRSKKKYYKEEFMDLYDKTITKFNNEVFPLKARERKSNIDEHLKLLPPIESLSSAEIAAFLSYVVMATTEVTENQCNFDGTGELMLPKLSEAEMKSPIGMAFKSFLKLFLCIERDLKLSRRRSALSSKQTAIIADFDIPAPVYQRYNNNYKNGVNYSSSLPNQKRIKAYTHIHHHNNHIDGFDMSLRSSSGNYDASAYMHQNTYKGLNQSHKVLSNHDQKAREETFVSTAPSYQHVSMPSAPIHHHHGNYYSVNKLNKLPSKHIPSATLNQHQDFQFDLSLSLSSSDHDVESFKNILRHRNSLDINDPMYADAHEQATSNLQMLSSLLSSREAEEEDKVKNQSSTESSIQQNERKRKR